MVARKYTDKDILMALAEGMTRKEIAKNYVHTDIRPIDNYMKSQGYGWNKDSNMYRKVRTTVAGFTSSIETKEKVFDIITCFTAGIEAKDVAKQFGFPSNRELATYMKQQGFEWNNDKRNYMPKEVETFIQPNENIKANHLVKMESLTINATQLTVTWKNGQTTTVDLPTSLEDGATKVSFTYNDVQYKDIALTTPYIAPDVDAPVIQVDGSTTINLANGSTLILPQVFAVDNKDSNVAVTSKITNSTGTELSTIDTTVAGTYTITYNAQDLAGNEADKVIVTVIVEEAPFEVISIGAITETITQGTEYALPEIFDVTVEGSTTPVAMQVNWSGTVDTAVVGEQTFTGTLVLPEGYTNPSNITAKATITVEAADTTAPAIAETGNEVVDYQTLKVVFTEAVTGTPVVKVNGSDIAASDITLAEDGKSLTIKKIAGYAAGTYNVTVTGLADTANNPLEANSQVILTKEASFISDFNVTTTGLSAGVPSSKVYFKVFDQYGEDITSNLGSNALDDNVVVEGTMNELPLTVTYVKDSGNTYITITEALVEGATVNVSLKNTVNSKDYVKNATFTVQKQATAVATTVTTITSSATAYEAGNDDVTLTATILDQFGNPYTLAGGEKLRWTTSNANVVILDNNDDDASDGSFVDGTAGDNTIAIDTLAPGTATVKVFLPNQTTAAKSLAITVADGELDTIDATNVTANGLAVTNKATLTEANIAVNDATASEYILFKNANGSNVPVLASTVSTSVNVKGTNTDASDVVSIEKVVDANGFLTGFKVTTNRKEQETAAVATNPDKEYTVTVTSGSKTATFEVDSSIDDTVASISDITFNANELTNNGSVVKAVTFKNQYGEAIEVLDGTNGSGSANVKWTTTAGLTVETAKNATGDTADAADAVTHLKFSATSLGNKTAAISAGNAIKNANVTVAVESALTSFTLDTNSATVIIDDTYDIGDKTANDNVLMDDTATPDTVVLIPVSFYDQYNNKIAVNADDFDMVFTGAADATKPVFALYGAKTDGTAALADSAATEVKYIGIKAETGDTTQAVTLQLKDEAGAVNIGTAKQVNVTVKAARTLNSISVTPASLTTTVDAKVTYTLSGVDQYGVAVDLTDSKVKLDSPSSGVTMDTANITNIPEDNKTFFNLTATAAGTYAAKVYYDADGGDDLDADEKFTTVNLVAGTVANVVNRIEINPIVSVLDSTDADGSYNTDTSIVGLNESDADQTMTFGILAYDANNQLVAVNQEDDIIYTITNNSITDADATLSFVKNTLTVDTTNTTFDADDAFTIKATSKNGKEDTLVVKVADITDSAFSNAANGSYYLATTASGKESVSSLEVDETGTIHVVGVNKFGQQVNVVENAATPTTHAKVIGVATDDAAIATATATANGITISGVGLGTTTLRVFLADGSQLTLNVTVTVVSPQ